MSAALPISLPRHGVKRRTGPPGRPWTCGGAFNGKKVPGGLYGAQRAATGLLAPWQSWLRGKTGCRTRPVMFFDGDIDMVARALVVMFGKDAPARAAGADLPAARQHLP